MGRTRWGEEKMRAAQNQGLPTPTCQPKCFRTMDSSKVSIALVLFPEEWIRVGLWVSFPD